MKKLISILLSVLMLAGVMTAVPVSAAEVGSNSEFAYVISGNEITITSYLGKQYNVTVPGSIDGCPVTGIGTGAFAHKDASALRSVRLPASITALEDGAFTDLSSSFVLYYDGTKTDWEENVTVGSGNDGFTLYRMRFLYDEAFWYCINTWDRITITASRDRLENIVIPAEIDGYTVAEIGGYCFDDDWTTKTLSLPDTVKNLGYCSIGECSITTIFIGSGLETISPSAFEYNTHLTDIYYNGTEESWAKIEISEDGNERLNEAQFHFIPEDSDGLEYRWNNDGTLCVSGYHGAETDVTIPVKYAGVKVTAVGNNAFYYNKTITSVTIPSSVQSVRAQAFMGANKLAKVSLTEGLEIIGSNAFRATAIETIAIPSTVKRIGYLSFFKCSNLSDVTVPEGVTVIDRGAFAGGTMKSVTIPESVISLDSYCFGYLYDSDTGKYIPVEDFVIYGTKGSAAEKYAAKNGFTFVDSSEAIIDTINITNLYAPRVGKTLPDSADTDGHYTIDSISWYDVYAEKWLSSSDTVVSGKQYEANIHVAVENGYKFADYTTITAAVDDSPAVVTTVAMGDHSQILNVRVTYPAFENDLTEVSQIDVTGVTAPEELAEISKTAEAGIYCNVVNVNWYDVEGNKWMKDGERFVKHKQYEVNINIRAVDGCEFVDISKVKATVNGKEATVDSVTYQDESEYLNIRFTFTAEPKFISYVSDADITGVVEPKAGEKAVFTFDENPYFTVKNNVVDWYCADDHYNLKEGDTFEEGKTYRAYFMITAKDGYKFTVEANGTSSVKSTVNGKAAETQTLTSNTYDAEKTIRIRCDFAVPSSSTEPQETTAPQETTEPAKPTEPEETTAPDNPTEPQPTMEPIEEPERTDISDWNVSGIKSKTYTGKAIKQTIKVTKDGNYAEFEATYTNNVNAGTATVKLTGIGEYKGSITKTFKITKAKQPMKVTLAKTKSVKLSKAKKAKQTVKKTVTVKYNKGAVTCAKVKKGSSKYLSISKKGVITVAKYKKYKKQTLKIKVKVTAKGNKNYKSGSKTVTVKIKLK